MRSNQQLDILRHDPARLAAAMRQQADTALRDPHWTPAQQQWRHNYYTEQAERLERSAEAQNG